MNRIIADYMKWSEDRNDVMFASEDSQSMETNPFHRIYRFCKYNPLTYPAYFLHTMAALSKSFQLRGGVDTLGLDDDLRMHLEDVIERQNVKNIVDRILTEFSPWEKRCSYDAKTRMYRLTIFYQTLDELDLVVRLLGYGANIRFVDKAHPIFVEIQQRMNRQMDLIKERREKSSVQEPGDNR